MNIWVDANGWPIPPTVLLGCLVAEILYFRGWRVLVKAEQAKRAARSRATARVGPSIHRDTCPPGRVPTTFTGSDGGEFQWNSWFWRGTYFLGAILTLLLASSAPLTLSLAGSCGFT